MKYKKIDINGLIVAGFSPFHADGSINIAPIPKLVDNLITLGANGFYLMGSTGEGVSMTVDQRKQVTEAYTNAIAKRVTVIVNVSHTSYEVSADLTRHAIEMGADAVSATLPSYYTISTLDQLVYAVQKIADCQDRIPFLYYHIPGKTGLNFKMHRFLERISDKLPQLGGIKYTSGTIDDFMLCKQLFGNEYKMFFGVDELFLPALAMGADAFIGSTYNFMFPLYKDILHHYGNGNQKEAINSYFEAVQIIDAFLQYDGLAAQKAIMKMLGHDFGGTKSPVLSLTKKEYVSLGTKLEKLNYFDHIQKK
ncbi:MAG: dihydrodipicolinate synthase family protein [Sediminicola sp.]